jgi:hypothetical protein
MTVISFGPFPPSPASGGGSSVNVSGKMSPETERLVRKLVLQNTNNTRCTHGPMSVEKLITMLLEDVAAAMRDGNTWQGGHMALVLSEHGYWCGADDE